MLSPSQRAIVSACVPALKEHGLTLTRNFYQRLFSAHPALKNVFNMSHQATGEQQQALANAVLAYAEHIDGPEALAPALRVIAAKHASMGIRAEHYPLVGRHLLGAIEEVMGDAATPVVMNAWAAAYDQLASTLIGAEMQLYQEAAAAPGGWSGWRPFRVLRADAESAVIRSIYLQPTDGGELPPFKAGQFISVRRVDDAGLAQVRQYSLSDAPGRGHLRISVKRVNWATRRPG
jgi:nitric oxide dioxygenase